MKKNQIIILAVVIVLIFGGILGWALSQKTKIPPGEGITPKEEEVKEVFSLSALVSSVDVENNFLKMMIDTITVAVKGKCPLIVKRKCHPLLSTYILKLLRQGWFRGGL